MNSMICLAECQNMGVTLSASIQPIVSVCANPTAEQAPGVADHNDGMLFHLQGLPSLA